MDKHNQNKPYWGIFVLVTLIKIGSLLIVICGITLHYKVAYSEQRQHVLTKT